MRPPGPRSPHPRDQRPGTGSDCNVFFTTEDTGVVEAPALGAVMGTGSALATVDSVLLSTLLTALLAAPVTWLATPPTADVAPDKVWVTPGRLPPPVPGTPGMTPPPDGDDPPEAEEDVVLAPPAPPLPLVVLAPTAPPLPGVPPPAPPGAPAPEAPPARPPPAVLKAGLAMLEAASAEAAVEREAPDPDSAWGVTSAAATAAEVNATPARALRNPPAPPLV